MDITDIVLTGKLKKPGDTMVFPVERNGVLVPKWNVEVVEGDAQLNWFNDDFSSDVTADHLTYVALPSTAILRFYGTQSIPFKSAGKIENTRRYPFHTELTTDGPSLLKLHPGTYCEISDISDPYILFTAVDTPAKYQDRREAMEDFVYNKGKTSVVQKDDLDAVRAAINHAKDRLVVESLYLASDIEVLMAAGEARRHISEALSMLDRAKTYFPESLAYRERGNRVIQLPGAMIFPDYCASRLPGWIAKEFNGSPEFGFALGEFTGPRPGEVLHYHGGARDAVGDGIMEPYLGREGELRLFVGIEGGSERLVINDKQTGLPTEYRGEILPIGEGDVVIPRMGVRHRIVFDGARFPFYQYCINYADKTLDQIPESDRVVLERM